MIDKIKAEADAIPCGKDEKINALEALLKLAINERDEALAYAERQNKALIDATDWNWISAREKAEDDGVDFFDIDEMQGIYEISQEKPPAALAALKAEWQAEVVEKFLYGITSSEIARIYNLRPDARIEWFRKRSKVTGDE